MSVNPDLANERKRASFKVEDASRVLYTEDSLAKIERIWSYVRKEPALEVTDLYYLDGEKRYERACERAEAFVRILRENGLTDDDDAVKLLLLAMGEDCFVHLHFVMFRPCVENLCDDEQYGWWGKATREFRILGTYAQSELAHGSNVAALQTTATLDKETDEWVLQTPNREAMKWWPGGLARSTTHCVVMARMIIDGKDYGVQPFMLQQRDLDTHRPAKGVKLICIGKKMNYNGMDNGAMWLEKVRIPRRWLLSRFVSVDKDGKFKVTGNPKIVYSTMTYTRVQIILASAHYLAKAAVIATRYSAVRRQFPALDLEKLPKISNMASAPEAQVLDYKTQQYVLFPYMACAFGFKFVFEWIAQFTEHTISQAKEDNFERLSELHIATSAIKASMTKWTAEGMEALRKSLGGHGYLLASGIAFAATQYLPQATYEGDFVVLSIQCGRALLREVAQKFKSGAPSVAHDVHYKYLLDFDPFAVVEVPEEAVELDFEDLDFLLRIFKQRAAVLVYKCAEKAVTPEVANLPPMARLDNIKIEMTRITLAHSHVIVLEKFMDQVKELPDENTFKPVLRRLCQLYALYWIDSNLGEFLVAKTMSAGHHSQIFSTMMRLFEALRPEAVTIADSWRYPDFVLNSALGRSDGRAYEALLETTKLESLNKTEIHPSYYKSIQYILHPERQKEDAWLFAKEEGGFMLNSSL